MSYDTTLWLNNLYAYSLQIALLLAIAGCLPWLLRVHSPRILLGYYQLLLLMCLLLPAVQPWKRVLPPPVPSASPSPAIPWQGTIPEEYIPGPAVFAEKPAAILLQNGISGSHSLSAPIVVSGLLGLGAVFLLLRFALGLLRLACHRRRSQSLRAVLPDIETIARSIGAAAEFRLSGQIRSPVTFGLRRPLILLPLQFPQLTESHRRAIVCHELLHVRRRDWLFILGEQLVCILFWFHPGIWWLADRIRLKREQTVDEQAARLMPDRRQYAQALLESAFLPLGQSTVPAPLFLTRNHLRQRVVLLFREVSMSRKRKVLSLVCMTTILTLAGVAAAWAFPLFVIPPDPSAPLPSNLEKPKILSSHSRGKILPPRLIHYVEPDFSSDVHGSSGEMKMETVIDEKGKIVICSCIKVRNPIWAVLDQWKFEPASLEGTPLAYGTTIAIRYKKAAADDKPKVDWQLEQGQEFQKGICYHRWVPAYPAEAIRQGIQGEVALKISVDEWGHVWEVQALDGPEPLRAAAVEAARQYRYSPGRLGDKPVFFYTMETVSFRLARSQEYGWIRGGLPVREVEEDLLTDRLLRAVWPQYPPAAREQKIPAKVSLLVLINENGAVEDSRVIDGHPLLNEAARSAIRAFQYAPVREYSATDPEGKAVPVSAIQNVFFEGTASTFQDTRVETNPYSIASAENSYAREGVGTSSAISPVRQVPPVYPELAKAAGVQGIVRMQVTVDKEGKVGQVKIVKGHPLLDQAAVDAVRQWIFPPAALEGKSETVTTNVTMHFFQDPETAKNTDLAETSSGEKPIRVGGAEMVPLKRVEPVYPESAKEAGIHGIVLMQVVVDKEGNVSKVKIIKGVPQLDQAAIDAVRQWVYKPTHLNGKPVSVITTVSMVFRLPAGIPKTAPKDSSKSMVVQQSNQPVGTADLPPGSDGPNQEPDLVKRVEPVYPEAARRAGTAGIVQMRLAIDEEGKVSQVKIVKGHPQLDQAAIEAVRQWMYRPAILDGKPISWETTITLTFDPSSPQDK